MNLYRIQKKNTESSTKRDVKNVQRWLFDNKKEPRALENIPPNHLNDFLAQMFIGIRKANGENYEPSSLEGIKNSVERYLKEKGYSTSLKDRVFNKAMAALTAKKVELKKIGLGRLPNKSEHLTDDEETKLYESGAFSSDSPRGLLSALYYSFGKLFGLRARD